MGTRIIAIYGKKQSGKDTIAGELMVHLPGSVSIFHFATPLKHACSNLFGVPLASFYDGMAKEEVILAWGMSPRTMMTSMQDILKHQYGDDFFVKRLSSDIGTLPEGRTVVIADLRFDCEAEWVKAQGGIIIEVRRPSDTSGDHVSEKGLRQYISDYMISNDGSEDDLRVKVHQLIKAKFIDKV